MGYDSPQRISFPRRTRALETMIANPSLVRTQTGRSVYRKRHGNQLQIPACKMNFNQYLPPPPETIFPSMLDVHVAGF